MQRLDIDTAQKNQVVDITSIVNDILQKNGFHNGLCHVFVTHTTCAIATADLDPGTDEDYTNALNAMIPKLNYNHPHDPSHVGDHIISTLIGPSEFLPVLNSSMDLGSYQRLVLIELNGPRKRQLIVNFVESR